MLYNVTSPPPQPYEFEKWIDANNRLEWLDRKWPISVYSSVVYVIAIFGLRHYMKSRTPFKLKLPLIIWNLSLAVFSIAGTCRMLPGFIHVLKEFGLAFSVCDNVYGFRLQASFFWGWLFVLSKVMELGDTLFIVLRKRELIFLHWYHHTVTLIMVWYVATFRVAMAHWTGMMNFTVHSFMYTYYTLRAMNIRVPKFVAMCITILQISQMIIGVCLVGYIMYLQKKDYPCHFPNSIYKFGFSVYASYGLLFIHYFYKSYVSGSPKRAIKKQE